MKNFIFFVTGLLLGGACGAYYYKTFVADKEMEEVLEENDDLKRKLRKSKKSGCKTGADENPEKPEKEHVEDIPEEIKETVQGYMGEFDGDPLKNDKFYGSPMVDPMEEAVKRGTYYKDEDTGEYIPCEPEDQDKAEEYQIFHDENKHRPPEFITLEDYLELGFCAFIEQTTLLYYATDCVLVDDDNVVVDEIDTEKMIGDCLINFDFEESDEKVIYVINYALDSIYQIVRVDEAYSEHGSEQTWVDLYAHPDKYGLAGGGN